MLLQFGGDDDGFAGEKGGNPLRGPGAFAGLVDVRQGLERNRFGDSLCERAAQIVPVPTHGEGGGTNGAAKIKDKDLGLLVAAKLQRHQRQEHALAGSGGPDDEGVADIADME